jgi:phosphohistidine phosphatase
VRLLIVRHAIAEEREGPPGSDADRRLSDGGRQKFRRGARALAELVPELAIVLTSPYRRARETAELLALTHPAHPRVRELAELAPGNAAREVAAVLPAAAKGGAIAVVGHEPLLSQLEGLLLTGDARSLAELRKGGAALLESLASPEPGGMVLIWHLTPSQLRELAG